MFALIFDCESNGFARRPTKSGKPDARSARVIQLAWELVDLESREIIEAEKFLIRPDGWQIPNKPFWVQHGYTTETNRKEGFAMPEVLAAFIDAYNAADVLVAHNLIFDNKAVGDEMIRYSTRPDKKPNMIKICTMKESTAYCQIEFSIRRGNKPPRLQELYFLLFAKEFEGAHDSGADVRACRECFFELVNRKIIVL